MSANLERPYRLAIDSIAGDLSAHRGRAVLAASTGARVMHETRLPPTVYFPAADVDQSILRRSVHRTFCPFKGTASWWDLALPNETVVNAAWSYQRALPEAAAIEGYVGFMPAVVDRYDGAAAVPAPTDDGNVTGALIDWLMREAWLCGDASTLTRQLGQRLVHDGIAVMRLNVSIWSLHPEIAGASYVWERTSDDVAVTNASHENLQQEAFINSPIRYVSAGLGGVRQSLSTDAAEFSFPIMADLRARGATDYVAMPLPFSNGQVNVLTLTSDHPKGFTTANLGLVFECSTVISRFYEVHTLRANAATLLGTYLGERTGARVLGGEIRRGDGVDIEAAILFCDLRHSARFAEQLRREDYLALLNAFFDTVVGLVQENGGEVLKFIGDAVLAIFPADAGAEQACRNALRATTAIFAGVGALEAPGEATASAPETRLNCAIGASFGRVTYGNVGSADRLDFTVVGAAANVAARLSDLGKVLGPPALVTAAIARAATKPLEALGAHTLHNVTEPVEVFAPRLG